MIANYQCDGQLSLFDFIITEPTEEDKPTWDDDLNEMKTYFDAWAERNGSIATEFEFAIWHHCPEYGPRATMKACIPRSIYNRRITDELESRIKSYKGIDASLYVLPSFGHSDHAAFVVYTMFTDERRKKKC